MRNFIMKKCILIYDDDKEILTLCKIILQKLNYSVEIRSECDNIIEDIKILNPDLILMDLWIPKCGGEKAITIMRENTVSKQIPVLLFSANDEIDKISKKTGANGYVQKPFDIVHFKKQIEKWI